MNRLRSILAVVFLLAAPAAMLWPVWSNPVSAEEDDLIYFLPVREQVGQALREGRWPLDDPLEATGMPLMADPQTAVMYPPTWMFAFLPAKLAYSLSVFVAFSLAGAGMYLYLRRVRLDRTPAAFGAVALAFGGFMVGHRVHLAVVNTAAFLPWGLWCIELLRRRPRASFAAAVPVMFLALTAGHWPTLIHMGLVLTVYFLFRARPFWRSIAVVAAAGVLAAALAAPQIAVTSELLTQATRSRIGYSTAGENSFHPAAAVLALFPLLMGNRTPNFYPQSYWGPWHLCEMLGYVGLVTLVLAGAGAWRLFRRPRGGQPVEAEACRELRGVVRAWVWIGVGALLWMLGYYLPTYRLVHAIPVLGMVRCPARMVLAADAALATLAAVTLHTVAAGVSPRVEALKRSVRRAARIYLPVAMVFVLAVIAVGGWALRGIWPDMIPQFKGGAEDALRALRPDNPALWAPLVMLAATVAVVLVWLASPRQRVLDSPQAAKPPGRSATNRGPRDAACQGRVGFVLALLVVDLFFVSAFVDVLPAGRIPQDVDQSPAARWLAENAPRDRKFRLWGLGESYCHRPAELMLPRTCNRAGFATIANYGPFQSPHHAHMLGFRVFGHNRNWRGLLRRNYLLSLYNVRYIICEAGGEHEALLASVRMAKSRPGPEGPNLLTGDWALTSAESAEGMLRLRTFSRLCWSLASQPVALEGGEVYHISLEARGPEGGAADYLQADVLELLPGEGYRQEDQWRLIVYPEQTGLDWRLFEWTFRAPADLSGEVVFRVFTPGERLVEVRNVSLRRSDWPAPVNVAALTGRRTSAGPDGSAFGPGERVYRKVAQLPPLNAGDLDVVIYENRLCLPFDNAQGKPDGVLARERRACPEPVERATSAEIEALRRMQWPGEPVTLGSPPPLGMRTSLDPGPMLLFATLPAGCVYAVVVILAWIIFRRKAQSARNQTPPHRVL